MSVSLTEGAVALITKGAVRSATEMKPILQVIELKPVNSQNQQSNAERFRLVVSDGSLRQQAMLATQKNELVKSGKLQIGSVVQLTSFICNNIQNRVIIIIMELDVLLEFCDIIGEPGFPNQQSPVTVNPQQYGGNSPTGGQVNRSNTSGPYASNQSSGRYGTYSSPPSVGPPGSMQPYQNMGFQNSRTEGSRPPMNAYSRPHQPPYQQQPPPMYIDRGPVSKNEAAPRIIPIDALNPYQGRWTIKARVTVKSDLRHYNNPRGDGKVFSFDLLDGDGGEIRVTCFNSVADQFYDQIEPGKVYMISKGSLKPAQKNFNHLRNDNEIFLESTSIVQPCFEEDNSIPKQQFFFRPINEVEGMDNNSIVDIIGVVSSISPATSIMRKNGTETQKRALQLKDMSGRSVELTLWGNFCNTEGQSLQSICDSGRFPVLAVKAGRVSDFNGKAIGTISTTQLFVEPDFPEAHILREWFEREGKSTHSVSISKDASTMSRTETRKTISQIKDERLGTSEKPDWITVSATVSFIKSDNFCYTACPIMIGDRQCSKKVTNNGDGKWVCDRCDQSVDECDYRYILQFQIQDHTGMTWVTAFQECGEEIMGKSAKELYFLRYEDQEDDEKFAEVIRSVLFSKYIFKLKVKEETFGDEQRVKSTVIKAERVNFSSESRYLLGLVSKLKAEDSSSSAVKPQIIAPNPRVQQLSHFAPTISNYNGNTGTRDFRAPANQQVQTQYESQYYGSRFPANPGAPGSYTHCNSCGGAGHSSVNCPSIMSDSGPPMGGGYVNRVSSGNASGECYKCHQSGHWARDCPQQLNQVPLAHGVNSGRYGGVSKQWVGGF